MTASWPVGSSPSMVQTSNMAFAVIYVDVDLPQSSSVTRPCVLKVH